MNSYKYKVVTSTGHGEGTVEAKTAEEAEKLLRTQFKGTHFVPVEDSDEYVERDIEIESVELEEQS